MDDNFTVTGTFEAHFHDPKLLDAFLTREEELQQEIKDFTDAIMCGDEETVQKVLDTWGLTL